MDLAWRSRAHEQALMVARTNELLLDTYTTSNSGKRKAQIFKHTAQQKEHSVGIAQQAYKVRSLWSRRASFDAACVTQADAQLTGSRSY